MTVAALSVFTDPLSSITNLLFVIPIVLVSMAVMVCWGIWLSRDRD